MTFKKYSLKTQFLISLIFIPFFWWKNILNLFYGICCFSGTFLTWFIVTRHQEVVWFRFLLLIFVSTVVISLEGSIIYSTFFSTAEENTELTTVFFSYIYSGFSKLWALVKCIF